MAGYPHITVPVGFVRGLPVGMSFFGPAWSEARLLALGYAYERLSANRGRRRSRGEPRPTEPLRAETTKPAGAGLAGGDCRLFL